MQCLDVRSSADGESVGLTDYQNAALVLELCREFQLEVDEALSSRPMGEPDIIPSINLLFSKFTLLQSHRPLSTAAKTWVRLGLTSLEAKLLVH